MSGEWSLNSSLDQATMFSGFTGVYVSGGTGSYQNIPTGLGTSPVIDTTTFSFNPFNSAPQTIWGFDYNSKHYNFDLTSLSIDQQTANGLMLSGTGILHIDGFDDTRGNWSFSAGPSRTGFSFSSNTRAVPDGGMTVMLLGTAMALLGTVRRFSRS